MEKKSIKRIILDELRGKGSRLLHNVKYKKGLNLLKIFKRDRIERLIPQLIEDKAYNFYGNLEIEAFITKEPRDFNHKLDGEYKRIAINDKWAEDVFDCAWFHIFGDVPDQYDGELMFLIGCGGEGLVYDRNGEPKQSITCSASDYDYSLGLPVKKVVLNQNLTDGKKIDFWIDGAANDLFGKFKNEARFSEAKIVGLNANIRGLAYDIQALIDCYDVNKNDDFIKTIYKTISKIVNKLDVLDETQAIAFRKELQPLLATKNANKQFEYLAIGHSHLDLAWLWPIRESKRKGGRTFATQLMNLNKYPNYIFGASQAQLYQWVKENYPSIYKQVGEKIEAGSWDVQGATWVEMDSNLISGESLIRQFFYGKQFFKKEFGKDMDILWLPDSFGYSACIPQVMKLADVPYFLTQKLSWNTVNKFPHHTFKWQGLDGTEVLAHMLPENTYNAPVRAESLKRGKDNYAQRDISNKSISLFGIGDGGAGPGFEHIERLSRYADLNGVPKVTPTKSSDAFKILDDKIINYPTYSGELYLERHQGTYTTQSNNKRYNRKCEFLLRNYEILTAFANEKGITLPITKAALDIMWKEILLYQFHDILPGSSINRVYEESVAHYEIIFNKLTVALKNLSRAMFGNGILNLNSYSYNKTLKIGDSWYNATIPPLSFVSQKDLVEVSEFNVKNASDNIENENIKVAFAHGRISSFFDKNLKKEFVPNGQPMCVITQYYDRGDCWDIRPTNYKGSRIEAKCNSLSTFTDGGRAFAKGLYELGDNRFTVIYSLFDKDSTLKIDITIDCHQSTSMLRCEFPTTIKSDICNFNIQFGHLARSTADKTSFEKAQFEVSGQKFVDLSENDCGLSILNDCKYGYRCKQNIIDVDLIRTPKGGPGTNVDQGENNVSLALFPHKGNLGADTYKEAYYLNNPLIINENCINDTESVTFASLSNQNIVLESVKIPEDNNGLILRLYNSSANNQTTSLHFDGYTTAEVANIMEEKIGDTTSKLAFNGFELKVVRIKK